MSAARLRSRARVQVMGGAFLLGALALTACSPKGGAAPDANASAAPVPPDAVNETWNSDQGPLQMVNVPSQHLRLSASCRTPANTFSCAAYTFFANPVHVDITPQDRAHGTSNGTLRCIKTNHQLVSGTDPAGNADGFCKMEDGSLLSVGSIESRPMP